MATTRRLIGNIKGPKGDTGATGATGAQGPAGQDGAPGVNDYATTEAAGLVRVGDDFNINSSNGTLSIKNAFTRASALAKTVTGEAFATSLGKIAKAVDWVVDNAPNFFNKNADIVDGFTSSLTTKALSANAGKTLKGQLDTLNDSLGNAAFFRTVKGYTPNTNVLLSWRDTYIQSNIGGGGSNYGYYFIVIKPFTAYDDMIVAIVRNADTSTEQEGIYPISINGSSSLFFSSSSHALCFKATSGGYAAVWITKIG